MEIPSLSSLHGRRFVTLESPMLVSSASAIPGYRVVPSGHAAIKSVGAVEAAPTHAPARQGSADITATGDTMALAIAALIADARIAGANAILDMQCRALSPAEAEAAYLAVGRAVFVEPE